MARNIISGNQLAGSGYYCQADFSFSWAFEQKGSGGRGLVAGGGRDTSICAQTHILFEGDKSDGCSKNTSLNITCLVLFKILADLNLIGS